MQDSLITGRLLIDGELVESEGAGWVDSINPANEQIIGRAPAGTRRDVERAVDAARRAWPAWAERTGEERGELLRTFGERIKARAEELSRIEVLDSGNTYSPTLASMHETVRSLRYYAGLIHGLHGETIPATGRHLHMTVHEPYGVVGTYRRVQPPGNVLCCAHRLGTGDRQHCCGQASGNFAVVSAAAGRDRAGSVAARGIQHRQRHWPRGWRCVGASPRGQAHRADRLGTDWHGDPAQRRAGWD